MKDDSIEETNSGVKKKGDIEDVAEFAREVEKGLKGEVEKNSIKDFNGWRPREDENHKDIEKKTVELASISEKKMEKESKGVKDFSEAGKNVVKAGKKAVKNESPHQELKQASKEIVRPICTESIKIARGFEEGVYSKIMVKFNPYFFDAKEFSADLRLNKDGSYSMQVNVPDNEHRSELKKRLKGQK